MLLLNLLMNHSVFMGFILRILRCCDLKVMICCYLCLECSLIKRVLCFNEEHLGRMESLSILDLLNKIADLVELNFVLEGQFYTVFILNKNSYTFEIINTRSHKRLPLQHSLNEIPDINLFSSNFLSLTPQFSCNTAIIHTKTTIIC